MNKIELLPLLFYISTYGARETWNFSLLLFSHQYKKIRFFFKFNFKPLSIVHISFLFLPSYLQAALSHQRKETFPIKSLFLDNQTFFSTPTNTMHIVQFLPVILHFSNICHNIKTVFNGSSTRHEPNLHSFKISRLCQDVVLP